MSNKPNTQLNDADLETPIENIQQWGFDAHPVVSPVAAGLVIAFVVAVPLFIDQVETAFNAAEAFITSTSGWFYVLATNVYLGTILYLALSDRGRVRIGGPQAKPEFSTFSWYAMLISAGMGIGLMFWSVAEPTHHLLFPPTFGAVEAGTGAAAKQAMAVTFFHWGLHPWGVYALVGLALGFFHFNRGLPLTISAIFYPLLKEKIYRWPGFVIDILAVLATLSGLATSLGSGAQQVSTGIHFVFGGNDTLTFQLVVVGLIILLSAVLVVSGLNRGIKILSEINIYLSVVLLLFVLFMGPTKFILDSFVESIGYYLSVLPSLSFWTEAFTSSHWQEQWTLFYWGWWIAWSPFVGTFIARVSKGRTLREFVFGVLIVPTLLSCLWMSVFGGTAIHLVFEGFTQLTDVINTNLATTLFVMLADLPLSQISSVIGIILVITFFVTSCNSGALVVNYLSSGGKLDPPIVQRIFWVVLEGGIASVLLIGGGLSALQVASITMGLPFAIVLLIMCYSLYQGLTEDMAAAEAEKVLPLRSPMSRFRDRLPRIPRQRP